MANKQTLLKKTKNILDSKLNRSWLHNVYVLYFIFIISIGYLYYLLVSSDWYYLSLFIILGLLTSFFSKNMIVILCIALCTTNILKYGVKKTMECFTIEGFEDEKDDNKKKSLDNLDKDIDTKDIKSKDIDTKDIKSKDIKSKDIETEEGYKNPTEKQRDSEKDGFDQKADNVYTELNDMDISKVYDEKDTILKNQEKLLKNLNQYKPLLDTINSITKSVSNIRQNNSK